MFPAMDLALLDDAAFDALPVGVVLIGRDGRVRRYNQAEARRAGLARWQVIGRDFVRELAWTIGAEAAARIAEFQARKLACDRFAARVNTRAGVAELDVTLSDLGGATAVVIRSTPPASRAAGASMQ